MNKKENILDLKKRVMTCRGKLQHIGVIGAKQNFCLKYPKYKENKDILDNFWYCKTSNEEFVKDLEEFVIYKESQFS